jgi:hypothetical protein
MRSKLPRAEAQLTKHVLTLPMESIGYVVHIDASKKGLGCVLM